MKSLTLDDDSTSSLKNDVQSTPSSEIMPVLRVEHLVKVFPRSPSIFSRLFSRNKKSSIQVNDEIRAVDDVSFRIGRNETFAVVGESGSGKTTLGMCALRLTEPTSGKVYLLGEELTSLGREKLQKLRGAMQIVFQDPSSSLDPRKRIMDSVSEPLRANGAKNRKTIASSVSEVLELVGLSGNQMGYFPHQFSGGQRQRIGIARAIILKPKFIVLDEPTSSLDASVQAQILSLLLKLQAELGLSYLLITHNISVARYMSDVVAVMFRGKFVEVGKTADVIRSPKHPYTKMLIASVLEPDPKTRRKISAKSKEELDRGDSSAGCSYRTRCPYARERCSESEPALRLIGDSSQAACHYAEEVMSVETPP